MWKSHVSGRELHPAVFLRHGLPGEPEFIRQQRNEARSWPDSPEECTAAGSRPGPHSYEPRETPLVSWLVLRVPLLLFTKPVGPVAVRAPAGESTLRFWAWSRSGSDPPPNGRSASQRPGACKRRLSHGRGRSQPAPAARLIPAGRLPAPPAAGPGGRGSLRRRRGPRCGRGEPDAHTLLRVCDFAAPTLAPLSSPASRFRFAALPARRQPCVAFAASRALPKRPSTYSIWQVVIAN